MGLVRTTLEVGKELTFEEQEAAKRRIEAASKRPYIYDPDCPLLTSEQLAEFRPVNYSTMEERTKAMKEAGILDAKTDEQEVDLKIAINK